MFRSLLQYKELTTQTHISCNIIIVVFLKPRGHYCCLQLCDHLVPKVLCLTCREYFALMFRLNYEKDTSLKRSPKIFSTVCQSFFTMQTLVKTET